MITKKEALELLGLNQNSTMSEIENRFGTLVKKYRTEQNNEKLEEISLAYNILTDRYIEPEPENLSMDKMFLGKKKRDWYNIWHYGRYKFLVILVALTIVVSLIFTMATNKEPDFKISAIGEFYIGDARKIQDYVNLNFPELEKVEFTNAFLSKDTLDLNAAYSQKAMILLSVAEEDVIVVDGSNFEKGAILGAFLDLNGFYDQIAAIAETENLTIFPVKAKIDNKDGTIGEEIIYGINISDSELLSAIGLNGRQQILTISINSQRKQLAKDFIEALFKDTPNLLQKVNKMPSPTPSPSPTPTPEPTKVS